MNRGAVVVVPEQPVLDWLRRVDPTSAELMLADLGQDPSIYLLPECDSDRNKENRLKEVCEQIFEDQLHGWYRAEEFWPVDRSFRIFRQWFDYQFHSVLIDLTNEPFLTEDL